MLEVKLTCEFANVQKRRTRMNAEATLWVKTNGKWKRETIRLEKPSKVRIEQNRKPRSEFDEALATTYLNLMMSNYQISYNKSLKHARTWYRFIFIISR